MPATKRPKPLYQRGDHKLYVREGRANLEVVWYDRDRKRERSFSTGTGDHEAARAVLDRHYLETTKGEGFCPTCGRPHADGGVQVSIAMMNYLTMSSEKASAGAIRARLGHVFAFIAETGQAEVRCDAVDEEWVSRFRRWAARQPIVSPTGKARPRSQATIEASVHQLAAAINQRGGIVPRFKPVQPKEVNATPTFRADVPTIAAMFRYCLDPAQAKARVSLLAFLRLSVATLARPDAVHDFTTSTATKQWNAAARVISLNPNGRRQTKKVRAIVPAARQIVHLLESTNGPFVPVASVRSAWERMATDLGLPGEGAAGMKLIRRSMADLVRQRLPQEAWGELEIFMGHRKFDATTDLYAPFRPDYLRRALAAIEGIIDDVEKAAPGAFYRADTAHTRSVVALLRRENG